MNTGRRLRQARWLAPLWLAAALACGGCWPQMNWPGKSAAPAVRVEPLAVQQAKAYPEASTGRFISLVDFEDAVLPAAPGREQVNNFSITGTGGARQYVVNITRTGVGALEVELPPGTSLVYHLKEVHDFSAYPLLTLAVYSADIRADLHVALQSDRAGWESLPVLLKSGWNDVQIDLQRLTRMEDFRSRDVKTIRLWFSDAAAPVKFHLDDIMLVDNRRDIGPTPPGMKLSKNGLDYTLVVPWRPQPVRIHQGDDGLWRLGADQTAVELILAGHEPPEGQSALQQAKAVEDLSAFGRRKVGEVEVLEANALRLRIANTWYFPQSPGQWVSLAVRQIRWEYIFLPDGRIVTDLVVNNAGEEDVSAVRVVPPTSAAWSDGRLARLAMGKLPGGVGRWSFLTAAEGDRTAFYENNYAKPPGVQLRMGRKQVCDGDANNDGFDESQGCWCLRSTAGHCQFRFTDIGAGLADAMVRIRGPWRSGVTASCEGEALRQQVVLPDGSLLLRIGELIHQSRWIEINGPVPLLEEP